MEIHELRAFLAVAEELNFRRAAERLGMSQPPLTRLIAKFEERLKTKLFIRDTRRVELTGAGVALLPEARSLLEQVAAAERKVREVGRLRRGRLEIHFSPGAFFSSWPRLVRSYRERFPAVEIALRQGSPADLAGRLRRGGADLVMTEAPLQDSGLKSSLIHREALGLLVPENHRLAKRKALALRDLHGEKLILHPRAESKAYYDGIEELLAREKVDCQIRLRGVDESCPLLVAIGEGVLFTVGRPKQGEWPGTTFIPMEGPGPQRFVHAFWKEESASLELESFLSFLREETLLAGDTMTCLLGSGAGKPLS